MYDDGSNNGNIDYNKKRTATARQIRAKAGRMSRIMRTVPILTPPIRREIIREHIHRGTPRRAAAALNMAAESIQTILGRKAEEKARLGEGDGSMPGMSDCGAAAGIGGAELWLNRDTAKDKQIQIGPERRRRRKARERISRARAGMSRTAHRLRERKAAIRPKMRIKRFRQMQTSGGYLVSGVAKSTGTQMSASEVYKKCSPQVVGISLSVSTQNAFGQVTSGTVSGTDLS